MGISSSADAEKRPTCNFLERGNTWQIRFLEIDPSDFGIVLSVFRTT